ncbi:MAG: Polypeptide-transport-associated domain protein FtsQ-type, partial [Polaromonas sp.]|nr:Polypeptide-transport-associated domain protein FtsQ-type [Polaromonas sp.]
MPLPAALPPDVRLMNTVSVFLGLAFCAMVLALGMAWLVRQPAFNLSTIRVGGDLVHN